MSGLQSDASGLVLHVRLTPNASADAVEGWQDSADGSRHLAVRVRAVRGRDLLQLRRQLRWQRKIPGILPPVPYRVMARMHKCEQ